MMMSVQYLINNNPYLKKYLRENSFYYKNLLRHPEFIYQLNDLMRISYKLTLPDKLDRIKDNIHMLNTFMDVLK